MDHYEQNGDIHNKKSRGSIRQDDEIDPISNELHVIQMNIKDESLFVISLDRNWLDIRDVTMSQREDIRQSQSHVYV